MYWHTQEDATKAGGDMQVIRVISQQSRHSDHRPGSAASSQMSSQTGISMRQLREKNQMSDAERIYTTNDTQGEQGLMYKANGELVLMPAPTQDPRDPLNMPYRQKMVGLTCLCLFGALAASAELILGAMLPVFALEYAHIDPKIIVPVVEKHLIPKGIDPLEFLSKLPGAPPIWKTYLLGSMPLLVMGISNLIFIPLSMAVGRRPVILCTGVAAITGAIWAGCSQSLDSHIAARCLQALGAGTVESLIPFIIQDTVFFHQRNTYISGVFAAQGAVIIILGISCPTMIIKLSWRWIYFITAAGAGAFLVGVFFFLPETRWHRSKSEMLGVPRPAHMDRDIEPRTFRYNIQFQTGPLEWKKGLLAVKDSLTTFFYPHIFFVTMLNSALIASTFAAAFIVAPQLIGAPYYWSFYNLGLCLIPVLIGAACVSLITGTCADKVANYFAKKRGRRLPENQLVNLVLPIICAIVGSIVFGVAGQHPEDYHWAVFLMGLGMMAFAFLGAGTVGAVYVLEAYPQLAGPALVNIAAFRCILAFIMSFQVSEMVVKLGFFKTMLVYIIVMAVFAALVPLVFVFGPAWRKRWPGPDR